MKFPEKEIVDLYLKGFDTLHIAKQHNTYNTSIRRILLKHNITPRKQEEVRTRVDNNIFQNLILSREEFYWLGLLITDGCISNNYLSLSLKEEDCYQLIKFAQFLGKKVKVNKQFNKKYEIFEYQVKVRDFKLIPNIRLLANFYNKSIELELNIPLNYDILRGIIDGDGSVGICRNMVRIQICSASLKFINQIKEFFTFEKIDCCLTINNTKSRKNTLYTISIHKQKQILLMYQKLYNDTDLYLVRKKEKYNQLIEKYKNETNS